MTGINIDTGSRVADFTKTENTNHMGKIHKKKKFKHITETETNTAAQQTKQQSDCVYEEKHCTVV